MESPSKIRSRLKSGMRQGLILAALLGGVTGLIVGGYIAIDGGDFESFVLGLCVPIAGFLGGAFILVPVCMVGEILSLEADRVGDLDTKKDRFDHVHPKRQEREKICELNGGEVHRERENVQERSNEADTSKYDREPEVDNEPSSNFKEDSGSAVPDNAPRGRNSGSRSGLSLGFIAWCAAVLLSAFTTWDFRGIEHRSQESSESLSLKDGFKYYVFHVPSNVIKVIIGKEVDWDYLRKVEDQGYFNKSPLLKDGQPMPSDARIKELKFDREGALSDER